MVAVQTSSLDSFVQLIGVLVIFVFVLLITYVATRWIAGYQKGHSFNRNLKVIETLKVTQNKYIQIAIGKDEIRLLTKLTEEQLKEVPTEELPMSFSSESFKDILDKIKKRIPKK